MLRKLFVGLAIIGALWAVYMGAALHAIPSARPHFARSSFTLIRPDGQSLNFQAELALSEPEQAYGLMFIKSLPPDAGMIFPYDPPREVAFWMKDTFIPLDMLFIGPDYKIDHLVTNARPHDLTPIPSGMPVMAVIEINGGEAEKQGIAVGDKVEFGPGAFSH